MKPKNNHTNSLNKELCQKKLQEQGFNVKVEHGVLFIYLDYTVEDQKSYEQIKQAKEVLRDTQFSYGFKFKQKENKDAK